MLVAQISGLHLRADPRDPSHSRFARLLRHLRSLDPVPDLLVLSGGLSADGELDSYRHLGATLARWPGKFRLTVGNRDRRAQLFRVFPDASADGCYAQTTAEFEACRVVVLDTLEPGHLAGGFCAVRAAWLADALRLRRTVPSLVILHHPPCHAGLDRVGSGQDKWTALLEETIAGHPVIALSAGHAHFGTVGVWNGRRLTTCPAASPDPALDLASVGGAGPDGGLHIQSGAPGFALHRWANARLTTYFGRCTGTAHDLRDAARGDPARCVQSARDGQ